MPAVTSSSPTARLVLWARLLCVLAALSLTTPPLEARAQSDAADAPAVDVFAADSREVVRDVLSSLSDAEARAALLAEADRRLAERAAARAAQDTRSAEEIVGAWFTALGRSLATNIENTALLGEEAGHRWARFAAARGDRSLHALFWAMGAALLGGVLAAVGLRWATRGWDAGLRDSRSSSLAGRVALVSYRFMLEARHLAVFAIAASIVTAVVTEGAPADAAFVSGIIRVCFWIGMTWLLANFVLSPRRADLRLVHASDADAWLITWRIVLIFGLSAVISAVIETADWSAGAPEDVIRIVFWPTLFVHLLGMDSVWRGRSALTSMMVGDRDAGPELRRFAELWPTIAVVVFAAQWVLIELLIANGAHERLSDTALNLTPAIILALPLLDNAVRAVVAEFWPVSAEGDPAVAAANRETQAGLMRFGRMIVGLIFLVVLADLWGLDPQAVAAQGLGAQVAAGVIDLIFVFVLAYGLWELMNVLTDRQIAIERAQLGVAADGETQQDGESGRGGTRLGTVMPLLRGVARFLILLMTLLILVAELGVNVTPLLAGAGVIGLALGFGAQTLVRDVLSGVFFLIDDAFRRGEYIEIGETRGTVESISIRSMQLRHHTGPLHTIPFGEIPRLTNYSRDWVIMKLPLRVTYDTDVERLRKIIKVLGQELLNDPELGPTFLEPLKSQGVIQMDDSAMIVRVKFKCRPGDQWVLRKTIYARVRELFAREGVHFAHREVTVRIAGDETLSDEDRRRAALGAASATLQRSPEEPP